MISEKELPPAARRLLIKREQLEANPPARLYNPDYGLQAEITRNPLELAKLIQDRDIREAKQRKFEEKNGVIKTQPEAVLAADFEETTSDDMVNEIPIAKPQLSLADKLKARIDENKDLPKDSEFDNKVREIAEQNRKENDLLINEIDPFTSINEMVSKLNSDELEDD